MLRYFDGGGRRDLHGVRIAGAGGGLSWAGIAWLSPMAETVHAYRKAGADQTEAEKVANAAAGALGGQLVSDGFWIDRERGAYAYAFRAGITYAEGRQALLDALDQVAPAHESNKPGWLRWLEVHD